MIYDNVRCPFVSFISRWCELMSHDVWSRVSRVWPMDLKKRHRLCQLLSLGCTGAVKLQMPISCCLTTNASHTSRKARKHPRGGALPPVARAPEGNRFADRFESREDSEGLKTTETYWKGTDIMFKSRLACVHDWRCAGGTPDSTYLLMESGEFLNRILNYLYIYIYIYIYILCIWTHVIVQIDNYCIHWYIYIYII